MVQKIIETKKCTQCGSNFDIFDQDLIFLDKLSPTIAWVKYQLPTPKICPNCRQQNRAVFRNRRNLYKRTCDLTGKSIVSMYSIEKPFKVYYNKDFENNFDATEYGRDIDFSKSILNQFYDLCSEVPHYHSAVMTDTMENSEYVNWSHWTKDSYLSFSVTDCEKVFHCEWIYRSYNCIDCYHVHDCELCYECIESSNMFRSMWCEYCVDCSYSNFCFNCENCNNCFLCSNIIGKSYCILNKQYTKEEYEQKIKEYIFSYNNIQKLKKEFDDLKVNSIHKFARLVNTESCVWDDLINAKNCFNCFGMEEVEDCRHCYFLNQSKDCMDILYYWTNLELSYQSVSAGSNSKKIYFSYDCFENVNNLFYCSYCGSNVQNCFVCSNLRNKQYCILNKQYTKEEYEVLIPKIITKMKEDWERWYFLPNYFSPFGYNESLAIEHFPIDKNNALELWFNRMDKEYNIDVPDDMETINTSDLSENIKDISDDILKKAIICEKTNKPFRIIKQELEFYKNLWLPIPHIHYNQRHKERFDRVNLKKIRDRKCDKCWIEIKTTYSPGKLEKVYCETCYNKEVYW